MLSVKESFFNFILLELAYFLPSNEWLLSTVIQSYSAAFVLFTVSHLAEYCLKDKL